MRGKRHPSGADLPSELSVYMGTLAATRFNRFNPVIRDLRLLAAGKPKKLALVACLRKPRHPQRHAQAALILHHSGNRRYFLLTSNTVAEQLLLPRLCHIICLSFTWETAMGHCRYCGHGAGWFRSSHRQCAATYRQGLAQMVDLVVAASGRPDFTQRQMLRILDELAQQCYVPAEYLPAVLAAGWHLSDMNRTVDRVPTRAETDWLRELRQGQLATAAAQAHEEPALLTAAVAAALATSNQPPRLERLSRLLERSGVTDVAGRTLLLRAWERAVARQLGDTGIDLDREAALLRYARHFDLDDAELDRYGMLRQFVQGAAIAESASRSGAPPHEFPTRRASVRTAAQVGAAGVAL